MKRSIFLVALSLVLMASLAVVSAGAVFASDDVESGVTYELDQVGTLPNTAENVSLFFGKGVVCEFRDVPGGFQTVHPREAVVVNGPESSEVTQPAAPSWWYFTGIGKALNGFVCQDQTPAPPAVQVERYGQIVGPYRYTHYACIMDNSQSNRPQDFTCRYITVKDGEDVEVKLRVTVPAHMINRTSFVHVRQGTNMWMFAHDNPYTAVNDGERIVQSRQVPEREWHGPLPSGWVPGLSYE